MKKIVIALVASVTLVACFAQEFITRHPTPTELDKIAGVTTPVRFSQPTYVTYLPGNEEQYDLILGGSNMNVIFASAPLPS